jgi:two-component system, NtrC family, sensor kinase
MRRRDKAGGKTARRRFKASRRQNRLKARNRDETLEQLAATSEVLEAISHSTFDLQTVLATLVKSAGRLCQAENVQIFLYDGEFYRLAADNGFSPEYQQYARDHPIRPGRNTLVARTALGIEPVQIPDALADPEYTYGGQKLGGYRTLLGVPLLRDKKCIGVIALTRSTVHPFTDRQIALVTNFAAQAVIAIENTRLLNELRESLQQQTATADVLKVISSSPGDMKPVFEAMLAKALHICEAKFGHLLLYDGERFHATHLHDVPEPYRQFWQQHGPIRPDPNTGLARLARTGQVQHIPDLKADPAYANREALRVVTVEMAGARSLVAVPMLKENRLVGAIVIYRQEVRPFSDKQIELVQNFAAQAIIAIENTRLLNELRQRTDDLSESLEQQTATSEVLKVISSSPGDLEPVFQSMLANAVRICGAKFGTMLRAEDDGYRVVAMHGAPTTYAEERRRNPVLHVGPANPLARLAASKRLQHIADIRMEQAYLDRDGAFVQLANFAGARTLLMVPMLKENKLIGALAIYRQEVRPFSDKQIELVQNFATQAVIAIENTRLLNELRESLQQQTATADVLKVISSSPADLEPVFQAMLEKATQLCEAKFGVMFRFSDGTFRATSWLGNPPAHIVEQPHVVSENPHNLLTRIVSTKQPVHSPDLTKERAYIEGNPRYVALVEAVGARSLLFVPMLKNEELIGAIAIYWQEARSFTEKQMELISNFAAQAVIAIDNARLLTELRESLQQQTATADVLKVISRSTFDLGTVLQTLVESAARLCDADKTNISRQKDGVFFRAESRGFSPEFMDYVRNIPIQPDRGSAFGRALLERRAVHIPDVKADPEYTLVEGQRLGDYRTVLAVPMLREGAAIGVLSLTRSEVRPFSEKQIELATTFADQAAIAIENVRLFESVEARTRELAKSLEELRTTQDRLVQTQKLASLGQLTAGIAHEIKNPLNFVNNFSGLSAELIDELRGALAEMTMSERKRAEVTELMDTLRGNFDKVVQHGRRADTIVKNMLLHSRESSGEHRTVDINALVEESLNLAWHGARAEKQDFEITLKQSFDPSAGQVDIFPQDIRRALLNLISNGFYAAIRRRAATNGDNYEPTLMASTKNLGDRVEIRIRDNGTGIAPDVKEKMFNPFFTTKPTGEGTGLGLSISHDIIVKQHAGAIEVDTRPGEFTEIRVILPRTAVFV